jgi:hypothetical protein
MRLKSGDEANIVSLHDEWYDYLEFGRGLAPVRDHDGHMRDCESRRASWVK